jgi:hypothetical protein
MSLVKGWQIKCGFSQELVIRDLASWLGAVRRVRSRGSRGSRGSRCVICKCDRTLYLLSVAVIRGYWYSAFVFMYS